MSHSHRFVKEAAYYYTDENGGILHRKIKKRCECGEKTFTNQRRLSGTTYVNGINGVRKVPYNLVAVLDAVRAGSPVWVVEGEKDVETLRTLGETGTCSPDGAGSWDVTHAVHLAGAAEARIIADNDTPGRRYRAVVRQTLIGRVDRITAYASPTGKDLTDLIESGGTLAELEGDAPISTGIAAGLASQFAGANRRKSDPRLPGVDAFVVPKDWARVTHVAPPEVFERIINAPVIHHGTEGAVLAPTEIPVKCGGCGAFLMVETKKGAGRPCHRCRLVYETWVSG